MDYYEILSRINDYTNLPNGDLPAWSVNDYEHDFIQLCLESKTNTGIPYCRFIEVRIGMDDDEIIVISGSVFLDCYGQESLMEIACLYGYNEDEWNDLAFYEQCECVFESDTDTHSYFRTFYTIDEAFDYFKWLYQKG